MSKRLFISHATADAEIVGKFVDFLKLATDLKGRDIVCTSSATTKIPTGTPDFLKYLRDHLKDVELTIFILTKAFFESRFCWCELGACWMLSSNMFPAVIPPVKESEVQAVLAISQIGNFSHGVFFDELRSTLKSTLLLEIDDHEWGDAQRKFFIEIEKYIASKTALEIKPKPVEPSRPLSEVETYEQYVSTAQHYLAQLCEVTRLAFASTFCNEYSLKVQHTSPEELKRALDMKEVSMMPVDYIQTNSANPKIMACFSALAHLRDAWFEISEETKNVLQSKLGALPDIDKVAYWKYYLNIDLAPKLAVSELPNVAPKIKVIDQIIEQAEKEAQKPSLLDIIFKSKG
ncbi:MAG: hypothetical protein ACAI35_25760 [Candidatus Methylacidiphilales bacterium]